MIMRSFFAGHRSILVKFTLLLAVFAIDMTGWPELWREMGPTAFLRVPAAFAVLAVSLSCAAWVPFRGLRWAYAAVFALGTVSVLGYRFSVAAQPTYFDFVTMVDARSAWVDAFAMHGPATGLAVLASVLTFLAIATNPPPWLSGKGRFRHGFKLGIAILPALTFAALTIFLVERSGQVRGIPSAWQGLGFATIYGLETREGVTGTRQSVALARPRPQPAQDVVLIIDESVSANYLDLNAPGGGRSGLDERRPGWSISDFGIASSITNCSMHTNVSLRFGAQQGNFKERVATAPSIWAHARAAGLQTVYLYGQRGGLNENFMTDPERLEIDQSYYFPSVPMIDRDREIARLLAKRLANDQAEFILVNKAGVHFPLKDMYPPGTGRFQPESGYGSHTKDKQFWRLYQNNYRNAIDWSVGAFFDELFSRLGPVRPSATIFYTSDHGQTFYEHEPAGTVTHCRGQPAMEEGAVPLVVISSDPANGPDWNSAITARHDASSQFQIFSSLLLAMGYDQQAVTEAYGPSLLDQQSVPMAFAVRMYLRLGPEPLWKTIDPKKLYRPAQ